MAERVESGLPVVTAHAAATDATEGQIGNTGLHHHIVEAHPTGAGGVEHLLLLAFGPTEQIERQRFWPPADLSESVVEIIQRQNRQ